MTDAVYPYVWGWHKVLGWRYGQRCRILVSGGRCSSLVEFEDGGRVVTCRRGLRRAAESGR